MRHRITAGFIALSIAVCQISCALSVSAKGEAIAIENKDDFIEFSKNCTLDTWSQGKTVSLNCDIDFSGEKFSPIPTFGGHFNGNGHTLSGISFTENGSYEGVFRYIQKSGEVENLKVKGSFKPEGSKSYIGGITGENSGAIKECAFDGNIKGENVIGGIAGKNLTSGQIIACESSGGIIGENSTGGIVGKNEGIISDCINNAVINTTYEEKKRDISDLETDVGAVAESYIIKREESEESSVLGHSDTGGIVGFTSGIVQGCINNGSVGYQHIGYNIGGIAGRQSGYLSGCKNLGFIQGRKDVGGIVGQSEPYILLDVEKQDIENLRPELDKLHSMAQQLIDDANGLGDDMDSDLRQISDYSKDASDNAQSLIDQGSDFVDGNVDVINTEATELSDDLDKLTPSLDSLKNGADSAAEAIDAIVSAINGLDIDMPQLGSSISDMLRPLSGLSEDESDLRDAADALETAIYDLQKGIKFKDYDSINKAISSLSTALKDIVVSRRNLKTDLEEIQKILRNHPKSFEELGINAAEIAELLKQAKNETDNLITSIEDIDRNIGSVILDTDIDFSKLRTASGDLARAIDSLGGALSNLEYSVGSIEGSVRNFSYDADRYTLKVKDQIDKSLGELADGISLLKFSLEDINDAVTNMKETVNDISEKEAPEFVTLGDDFKDTSKDLFTNLSDISSSITDNLSDDISGSRSKISGDLTSLNDQFNTIVNIINDNVDELKSAGDDLSDPFYDASDEDIENTRQGKILGCINNGAVEADRNTGGIAGAMAIEYEKDPEDELEKPDALNFTYRTKAVLQSCVNNGTVTGKKDCVGGVVGLAEIGTVYECESYGSTESTDGDYIGGTAGKSESYIRRCYAKGKVAGKRYVGGIAGNGNIITACKSIVDVEGDESTGSVCGYTDDRSKLGSNYFVDSGLGAVDGISYSGIAEPIGFDELKTMNVPKHFIGFTVTFTADGSIIGTQELAYGESTKRIKYPDIPAKEGYFGKWQKVTAASITEDMEIECVYQPNITVLSSEEKDESGKLALALAEGEFTDTAHLYITENKDIPPVNEIGNSVVYDITISDADINDDDSMTLRILNKDKDKVTAWRKNGDSWEQLETSYRGRYVLLNTTGSKNTVCLQYTKKAASLILLLIPAAIALSAILAASVLIIKKRRKNKQNKQ